MPARVPPRRPAPSTAPRELARLRARVDELDRALARLARRRLAAVRAIAGLKKAEGLPAIDRAREAQVRAVYRRALGTDPLADALPDALLAAGRRAQRRR